MMKRILIIASIFAVVLSSSVFAEGFVPNTGDSFNPILIIVIMGLCIAAITFVLLRKTKGQDSKEDDR